MRRKARLNIRLMADEYVITSPYGNAVISNKITITAKEVNHTLNSFFE